MKYAGDVSDTGATDAVANVKLDHQLKLSGTTFNKTDKQYKEEDWTSDNIAVVSNAVDKDGNAVMNLKLAKDLKDLHSSTYTTTETTGKGDQQKTTRYTTTIDSKGLKITDGPSITNTGVDAGNKAITNVGSGADAASGSYTTTTNAANIGDVQNIVKDAIDSASDTTNKALAGKANIDASNIGANAEKWGSAIGTGEIKADDGRMVTGKTVYGEVRPKDNGNYVKKDKTTGENLSALDSKIGKLDETKKYNYIDSKSTTSISDNLGKLDTQVKNNADAIQRNSESIQNITNNVQNLSDNAVQYDKDSNKSKVTLAGKDGTTITKVKEGV